MEKDDVRGLLSAMLANKKAYAAKMGEMKVGSSAAF